MKRSIWSLVLLCAAVGCGEERAADPFGESDGGGALGGGGLISGGSGSASGTGSPGGSPAGSNPGGSGQCSAQTVQSGRLSPDILIVMDRSLSMKMDNVNRWDPSVSGLKSITAMLEDRVSFGLMVFPGPNAPAGDSRSCDPGTSRVPVGPKHAGEIAAALDATQPGGRTPTAPTLKAARELIDRTRQVDPDTRAAPQYVLLVTDGAPNCSDGGGGGVGTGFGAGEPAAVDQSVAEIEAMTKTGIRTYVLGYDTQNDAQLRGSLDRMAQVGGTGAKAHQPIEDEASLVNAIRKVTEVALTCEFVLEAAVRDKSYVKVTLDGKQLNVDTDDGWRLNGDNTVVTLQGDACAKIKKEGHVLSVSVECEQVGTVF